MLDVEASIEIGEGAVAVKLKRRSSVSVARILGREIHGGTERLYLDSRLHAYQGQLIGDWTACGAVSTILERRAAN